MCSWVCLKVKTEKKLKNSFYLHHTVPKKIDFPWYNLKCSGENVILRGIFHVVSFFPKHFVLYRGNLDYFSDRVVFTLCGVEIVEFCILMYGYVIRMYTRPSSWNEDRQKSCYLRTFLKAIKLPPDTHKSVDVSI